jgi:hypothetical protein
VNIVHVRPVIIPLSDQAVKVRGLNQQKAILQDQMIVLRTMVGQDWNSKLERCQVEYKRVTDDIYLISEGAQVSLQCLLLHSFLINLHFTGECSRQPNAGA